MHLACCAAEQLDARSAYSALSLISREQTRLNSREQTRLNSQEQTRAPKTRKHAHLKLQLKLQENRDVLIKELKDLKTRLEAEREAKHQRAVLLKKTSGVRYKTQPPPGPR